MNTQIVFTNRNNVEKTVMLEFAGGVLLVCVDNRYGLDAKLPT